METGLKVHLRAWKYTFIVNFGKFSVDYTKEICASFWALKDVKI